MILLQIVVMLNPKQNVQQCTIFHKYSCTHERIRLNTWVNILSL